MWRTTSAILSILVPLRAQHTYKYIVNLSYFCEVSVHTCVYINCIYSVYAFDGAMCTYVHMYMYILFETDILYQREERVKDTCMIQDISRTGRVAQSAHTLSLRERVECSKKIFIYIYLYSNLHYWCTHYTGIQCIKAMVNLCVVYDSLMVHFCFFCAALVKKSIPSRRTLDSLMAMVTTTQTQVPITMDNTGKQGHSIIPMVRPSHGWCLDCGCSV